MSLIANRTSRVSRNMLVEYSRAPRRGRAYSGRPGFSLRNQDPGRREYALPRRGEGKRLFRGSGFEALELFRHESVPGLELQRACLQLYRFLCVPEPELNVRERVE